MRSSMGGCVENSAMNPPLLVMPLAAIDCGSAPGSSPPKRDSALTIGVGEPSNCAEAASARNSRRRENQATIKEARMHLRTKI